MGDTSRIYISHDRQFLLFSLTFYILILIYTSKNEVIFSIVTSLSVVEGTSFLSINYPSKPQTYPFYGLSTTFS